MTAPPKSTEISTEFVQAIVPRIEANQRVRRSLPGWGRISIERQLPYLVVYRRPEDRLDPGTDRLAVTAPSYLIASSDKASLRGVRKLTRAVVGELANVFGAVLVVEIWVNPGIAPDPDAAGGTDPRFRIVVPRRFSGADYVAELQTRLATVRILKRVATAAVDPGASAAPPGLPPLLTPKDASASGCHLIGIEMAPVHQNAEGDQSYPTVLRELRRQLGRALGRTFYEFAGSETARRPRSYHDLGRRAMVKAVWEADRRLAEIGSSFDLLLDVTPANAERAWWAFQRQRFDRPPAFRYRPLAIDPSVLKRRLHDIRLDRVEDPTVAHLFHEQQELIDRQLTLLSDRGKPAFLYGSLALYGKVDAHLHTMALGILEQIDPTPGRNGGRSIDADAFAAMARAELARYGQRFPDLQSGVEVRDDVSSLMVSRGKLLIGRSVRIPATRAEALIQHEIGTHVVTHVNGSQQRFRLLASGLAGYEALQEGIGVFAEFAVGGLSASRLRLLAARVVAAEMVAAGSVFVETYRELTTRYGLQKRLAFLVAMRVHRGGGFVKDAVYLRGLAGLFEYLADGGDFATLLVGKIAMRHTGVVEELLRRQVVRGPALLPTYLDDEEARIRIDRVRGGLTVSDVTEELRRRKASTA